MVAPVSTVGLQLKQYSTFVLSCTFPMLITINLGENNRILLFLKWQEIYWKNILVVSRRNSCIPVFCRDGNQSKSMNFASGKHLSLQGTSIWCSNNLCHFLLVQVFTFPGEGGGLAQVCNPGQLKRLKRVWPLENHSRQASCPTASPLCNIWSIFEFFSF